MFRRWLPIALIAVASGCAARSTAYRLVPDAGSDMTLIPPGVKDENVFERRLRLRQESAGGECPTIHESIGLSLRKKHLRLTLSQNALNLRPAGWLLGWAAALEQSGCLSPGQGLVVARAVAQALPAGRSREYRLLHSATGKTGRTDLLPWTLLRVTSPVFKPGAPPDAQAISDEQADVEQVPGGLAVTLRASDDFLGYEVATYALRPRPEGGSRLELEFAETHIGDETTVSGQARNPIILQEHVRYFRMLVLTRVSDRNQDTALLATGTLSELQQLTREVEADPARCEQVGSPGGCLALDRQVALLPFVSLKVDGRDIAVLPGVTVRSALEEAGVDLDVVSPRLVVERDYFGRLAPVEGAVGALLGLRILGGEVIHWTKSASAN